MRGQGIAFARGPWSRGARVRGQGIALLVAPDSVVP